MENVLFLFYCYPCDFVVIPPSLSHRDESHEFRRVVEKLERNSVCQRLPLRSFLILPFQRITRLKLLVQVLSCLILLLTIFDDTFPQVCRKCHDSCLLGAHAFLCLLRLCYSNIILDVIHLMLHFKCPFFSLLVEYCKENRSKNQG